MKLKPLFLIGLLLFFLSFSFSNLKVSGTLVLEDFTSYTISEEVVGRVDVINSTHIIMHGFENETTYANTDKGADFFGANYYLELDCMIENITGAVQAYSWIVSDVTGKSRKQMVDDGNNHLEFHFITTAVRILENDGGTIYFDTYSVTTSGKWFFLTINKTGTSFVAGVYNNTARTVAYLEDTLSLTLHDGSQTYRYLGAVITRDRDAAVWYDLSVAYLYLETPDLIQPSYHYPFGLNSTLNGSGIQFTVNFSDNEELDIGLLSWNNSGSWANVSLVLSGTVDLALWNQTLNATSGLRIEYLFYVNDTSNNWNQTIQHFIYTNTKPIVLVVSDAGVLFIGALIVFSLLGGIFILGKRKR